jgi:phosphate transport system substrate-binding protein
MGCSPAPPPERIIGGGATSIEPLINAWQPTYAAEHAVQVDYTGAGSGNGVQQMIRRAILFGCTDAPLNAEQLDAARSVGGEVIHLPLAICGVVPICRVPGIPDGAILQFSGEVLAKIFLGEITQWNDAALRELNPTIDLPNHPIKVVSRSEPSGTTAVFAEYLAGACPELWRASNMGRGSSVAFAVGIRQKGNPGVAGEVFRNPGAIGYVDLTYAMHMSRPISFGSVRNRAGHFVRATNENIAAAAAALQRIPDDLCFSLIDAGGSESYPICGVNWAVFYKRQTGASGRLLVEFLHWAIRPDGGQEFTASLGYASLPPVLEMLASRKLGTVQLD